MDVLVFSMISLVDAVICVVFGTLVFTKNFRSRLNQIYMLLCTSIAYWAFAEYELRQATAADEAQFWARAIFIWPFAIALLFHFALIFTRKRHLLKLKMTYILLYGTASVVALLALLSPQMQASVTKEFWGWTAQVPGTTVYWISSISFACLAAAAVVMASAYYRRQSDPIDRKKARLVAIGLAVPVIFGMASEIIIPMFGISWPGMITTSFAVGAAAISGYAIYKYELFGITLEHAARKIIGAISDSMFLIDPFGRVLTVNQSALELLDYSEDELVGYRLNRVLKRNQHQGEFDWQDTVDHESMGICQLEAFLVGKEGCRIPVSLSDSKIRDRLGRILGSVIIARDITERIRAENALRESEHRLRIIMKSVQAGIIIIDPDTHKIVEVNAIAARMIGAPTEEIVGSVCHKYICPAECGKCPITDLHRSVDNSERVMITAGGEERSIIKSVTTVSLAGKEHLLESCIDITDRKKMEQQLSESLAEKEMLVQTLDELATRDDLTGLYNHRAFYSLLSEEIARAERFARPVSLLMIDIDHFKRVNDAHGHLAGDAILSALSELLTSHARTIDRVCRYGGEEITVILPETGHKTSATMAERLRKAVEKTPFHIVTGAPVHITISIGVSTYPSDAESAQLLINTADTAMYAAKKQGRNRVVGYETMSSRPPLKH